MPKERKIYPLTSVRFFAAFLVVFHHSAATFLPVFAGMGVSRVPGNSVQDVLFSFTVSVSFFFLLSGYVLGMVYLREGLAVNRRRFFAARFARIYPLYFVMLVLDMPELLAPEIQRYGVVLGLAKTIKILAANAMMLQAWSPEHLLRLNAPTWSLCGEAFFYLCFPLLGPALWRLRGARLGMTVLGLYAGGQIMVWALRPHLSAQAVLYLPVLHLSTFALGILLARWQTLQREAGHSATVRKANSVFALSAVGMLLSVALLPLFRVAEPYNNGLLAPVLAGLIWSLSAAPTRLSRWLCKSWMVVLGNASYALYLFHFPLLLLFRRLQLTGVMLYPVYLTVCVGLSLFSFYYFETPVRLWLLERLQMRTVETVEAASSA